MNIAAYYQNSKAIRSVHFSDVRVVRSFTDRGLSKRAARGLNYSASLVHHLLAYGLGQFVLKFWKNRRDNKCDRAS